MSLTQPEQTDAGRRPSVGLSINLSSNNPFRNRAASPALSTSPHSPFAPPPRPVSRNPFLDASSTNILPAVGSPDKMSPGTAATSKPALTGNAAELFDNLTLSDRPATGSNEMHPPPKRSNTGDKPPPPYSSVSNRRGENVPPRGHPTHRPSQSQEEALRARKPGGSSRPRAADELDIFADPPESSSSRKPESRRPRRNSDSSVVSRSSKLVDPEEEKKRAERRRRERRHREGKSSSKSRRPDRKLDVIDKLDVTSIYGTGLFHHDGPFDACNPHRNRQGSRRAPMQAFPKDSLNNVLGGSGPLNKRPDHATFLGNNDEEAFRDYSSGRNGYDPTDAAARLSGRRQESNVVHATTRVEPIHGEETLGLGTSTFLEGAPASRNAMQRRDSEHTSPMEGGGLSRKKSLAQRIKSINSNRREYGPTGRMTSPDGILTSKSPDSATFTPGAGKVHDSNPFFEEFAKGDDSKKESITIVEPDKTGRARAPSSPRRGFTGLERRVTSDGTSGAEQTPKVGGGFLSRVKSLKGGPRKGKSAPEP